MQYSPIPTIENQPIQISKVRVNHPKMIIGMRQQIETHQKALEINLNEHIYGTFAEIGAGQEVARHFFQAGGAAGTIAKTMSAYDKIYSDEIYGVEPSGRYVCESRLYKMLNHEYDLMESRLQMERSESCFFVFADTIAAINYHKTIKGDGWLGIRFQLKPQSPPNDLVLHVRMLDNDNKQQQQAIGVLGVNLIYACHHYFDKPEQLLLSLMDNLHGRIKIDMVRLTGPQFMDIDNRLLCLYLVKNQLSELSIFGPNGQSLHASEFLYRKYLMVVQGSFRPPTLTDVDLINSSYQKFKQDPTIQSDKTNLLVEMPLESLSKNGDDPDLKDFMDRTTLLNALGYSVMVSACSDHHVMNQYFADYKIGQLAIVMQARDLLTLINEKYYQNQKGRLLAAFGELFSHKLRVYTYPTLQEGNEEWMTAENLPVPEGVKFLYRHLMDNQQIIDVAPLDPNVLNIFQDQVLHLIREGQTEWERMVPPKIARLIKSDHLFDFPSENLEFKY